MRNKMIAIRFILASAILFDGALPGNIIINNSGECNPANYYENVKFTSLQHFIDTRLKKQTTNIERMMGLQTGKIEKILDTQLKKLTVNLKLNIEQHTKEVRNELQKFCKGETKLVNVAFGKPAKQYPGDISKGYVASKAVDGKLDTYSHTSDGNGPRSWIVDLGKQYKIHRIEIYNVIESSIRCCADRLHDLDVTIGTTKSSMKLCAQFKGPGTSGQHIVLKCPALMSGRYVKLTITKNATWLHVAEVKVYAEDRK